MEVTIFSCSKEQVENELQEIIGDEKLADIVIDDNICKVLRKHFKNQHFHLKFNFQDEYEMVEIHFHPEKNIEDRSSLKQRGVQVGSVRYRIEVKESKEDEDLEVFFVEWVELDILDLNSIHLYSEELKKMRLRLLC